MMKAKSSGFYTSNSVNLFFKLFTLVLAGLPMTWANARDNDEYYYANRVEIYEHADYQGRSVTLYPDQREFDLREFNIHGYVNNFDNRISSVKVYGDAVLILYNDVALQGESLEINENIRDLEDYYMYDGDGWWDDENWNDAATSLEVFVEFGAKLYEDNYYDGDYLFLEAGESIPDLYELNCYSGGTWDDLISSVTLSRGVVLVLYEEPYYEGQSIHIDYDMARLSRAGDLFGTFGSWDNRASSLRVIVANEVDTYFPVSPMVLFPFPEIIFSSHSHRGGGYGRWDYPRYPNRDHRRNNPRVWRNYPVALFQHEYFDGDWSGLNGADRIPDLRALGMHDRISSVYVKPGWSVTFYEHENYRGRSVTMTFSEEDLRHIWNGQRTFNWSDKFSSMIIHHSNRPPNHGGGYGNNQGRPGHGDGRPGHGDGRPGHGDGRPGHGDGRPGHGDNNDGRPGHGNNPPGSYAGNDRGDRNDVTIINQDQKVILNNNNSGTFSSQKPGKVTKPVVGNKPQRTENSQQPVRTEVKQPTRGRPVPKPAVKKPVSQTTPNPTRTTVSNDKDKKPVYRKPSTVKPPVKKPEKTTTATTSRTQKKPAKAENKSSSRNSSTTRGKRPTVKDRSPRKSPPPPPPPKKVEETDNSGSKSSSGQKDSKSSTRQSRSSKRKGR